MQAENIGFPAAFLTVGAYYGTLAAARCLGKQDIPVVLADPGRLTPTGCSRFTQKFVKSPPTSNLSAYAEWLIEFGKENPGMVLFPTSDDLAWVIARNQKVLAESFLMYQAPEAAIYGLLNKQQLYTKAPYFDIETPETHFPYSEACLDALALQITYPVIVKPKTQIGMSVNVKGLISNNAAELRDHVRQFLQKFTYQPEMLRYDESLRWPMVQCFYPQASTDTYSLSGFMTRNLERIVVRGAKKVLQQPINIGVGMAFESRPIVTELQEKIGKFAQYLGYFGPFEVEFIHLKNENRYLLMDFNPRLYGQMGFEIKRGLPIPSLFYAAASGDEEKLTRLLDKAQSWDHEPVYKYRFGLMMFALLTTQWLGARLCGKSRRRWLSWANEGRYYDSVYDSKDRIPSVIDLCKMLIKIVRHPRSSFRYYFF